jgi:stage IV sporulation protein A
MEERYGVPVITVNCLDMGESEIRDIMAMVLYQFPMKEIQVEMPRWILGLDKGHWLKASLYKAIQEATFGIGRILDLSAQAGALSGCEHVKECGIQSIDFGTGSARMAVTVDGELFYKVLGELTGLEIDSESDLMSQIMQLAMAKREYDHIKNALDEVNATGYGIVMPTISELTLEEPEMMRQGGRYGIRLRASAPSIHMMKACITTEVAPIVGSEKQSEELVRYMMSEFEDSPEKIWQSNIFGKV